ncbi:MAG TPA: hypothetical protein ENO20_10850 [Bacteroides sp.]|nr:hypothetical protein [Bacteroides sp.]
MITVDQEKCNGCGICVKICHEHCLSLSGGKLNIEYEFCSTCSQCVAVCPRQAILWDHHPPLRFDRTLYPRPEQVMELFMERRTGREHTGKSIDRSTLKEIAAMAAYAPTHNFNMRTIIIDDAEIIRQIDSVIYRFSMNLYRWLYAPEIMHFVVRAFAPAWESEYLKARPKLEVLRNRQSLFRTMPAAVIMVVGNRRAPLSLQSAQYALYNMDLYAQSMGLACRNLVGNQGILNRNRQFRKLIRLNRKEKIFGTIALGHPAIRFRNKVTGKSLPVQWNNHTTGR